MLSCVRKKVQGMESPSTMQKDETAGSRGKMDHGRHKVKRRKKKFVAAKRWETY